jgi:membrane-associated phospholipid phosphatase
MLRQKIKNRILYFWLYFWYPVFYLLIIFQSLFWLLPALNQAVIVENRYDALLFTIDMLLVKVHPVIWFGERAHPLLTDVMYIVYLLYFFLPFVLLISLFIQRKFRELQEAYFILGFAFYMAYIGYIFVPARGPRFYLNLEPHTGLFLTRPIRDVINFLEPNKYDAFPSVHQLITVLVLILAYRYERRYFYYLLPIALGITISLFYCQYHYLIDVIVGSILAILFFIMGKYLLERTQGIFRDSMLMR